MNKRMLIDATHAEETRVVVMDGNRLEDYDVEAANRKQLKGNIYLAKVIRVEPSLQAAFVEYGGNRHGFLAFSEIHPDYYQIPVADREKLLALQEEEPAEEDLTDEASATDETEQAEETTGSEENSEETSSEQTPDYVGGETDTGEEAMVQKRMARFLRSYKIQEVIRRRQVLLVQVVKEERGNKGAALTTYISLAGRYCVLMPNALRGGGVSRKITSVADRKRLKDIIADLQLPRGMAMIVRTAGGQRPRPEVMRDCEYLLHLWDEIREHTLNSVAPALIYEEASLVKRAIRDVYTRDIDEILVDGEQGWRAARDFMRMLMPQSAQRVKLWRKENQPLFSHYQVEGQLDGMLSPTVQLRSGGYLVINQTEALVAIDVNSGRATRERNIEETAVKTNLEAADEVARQLRLRDLAGLIVIDFIDMESRRHNAQVERRLKDALRHDRARIQVGGISHFGLLEMSRQRLRPSVAESAFVPCPHCQGTGIVRGIESSALHVLRAVEDEGGQRRAAEIVVYVAGEIALYILNNKRDWLTAIETRHKMHVIFSADQSLPAPQIRIERRRAQTARFDVPAIAAPVEDESSSSDRHSSARKDGAASTETRTKVIAISDEPPAVANEARDPAVAQEDERGEGDGTGRRRRRRRRRRGPREEGTAETRNAEGVTAESTGEQPVAEEDPYADSVPAPATEPNENLVPGRNRTRYSRKTPSAPQAQARTPTEPRQTNERSQPAKTPAAASGWRGPTPADPFGGSFDIFDIMDQVDFEASSEPKPAPAPKPAAVRQHEPVPAVEVEDGEADHAVKAAETEATEGEEPVREARPARRRSRGRRGSGASRNAVEATREEPVEAAEPPASESETETDVLADEKPAPRGRRRTRRSAEAAPVAEASVAEALSEAPKEEASKNDRKPVVVEPKIIDEDTPVARPRTGWWRR
ncbi:rne/Rng family ribonuclease [Acetobacter aceti NRIC 0242]|uniref:Ribonuclease E n=1 Tax=Acetobacter aceti NBRC 14818 TaxID=887700 RepID=A0AB33IE56_ACEAC|nr:ribonuclease E/G [Acetobacter aceti]BCK75278.1 ribonuclease E [Acetobacter aceti NBRC 14818]GAN57432.1 ribonuclease E [Acetobacter aceti NBRC 14818]GBO79424.1 rne/Rng family ribonuclease [Acetobacter aceti NRIC 0242]